MRKIVQLLATLLSVILVISNLPMATAMQTANNFAWDYDYDSSLLVTVETDTRQTFTPQWFPAVPVGSVVVTQQLATDTGFLYELVLAMSLPEEESAAKECMENAIKTLQTDSRIRTVTRNRYASEYGQKESYIDLNERELLIPVGGQSQLYIEDKHLVSDYGNNAIGVQFEIDPAVFTTPVEQGCFYDYGILCFWALPDDLLVDRQGGLLYENYTPHEWFDDSLKNAVSAKGTYFGVVAEQNTIEENYARFFHKAVQNLSEVPGVKSAQVVYTHLALAGMPPHEQWASDNEDVVSISLIDGVPADVYIDRLLLGHRVTLSGNNVGTALVTVATGGGDVSRSASCLVTVYQPGDTTMDDRVNAADALSVLQHGVGKIVWEKDSAEYRAAEVTGDGEINAADALDILKYAVGKLKRFSSIPGGDWVKMDEVQFPDEGFREKVAETYDVDQDGYLSQTEIAAVKELNLQGMDINDLTGIGCFTALEMLDCSVNPLDELDLAYNPNLKSLICTDTSIKHLDLRYNKQLVTLQKEEGVTVYGWANQP